MCVCLCALMVLVRANCGITYVCPARCAGWLSTNRKFDVLLLFLIILIVVVVCVVASDNLLFLLLLFAPYSLTGQHQKKI